MKNQQAFGCDWLWLFLTLSGLLVVQVLPPVAAAADVAGQVRERYTLVGVLGSGSKHSGDTVAVIKDLDAGQTLVRGVGEYLSNGRHWLIQKIIGTTVYLRSQSHFKPVPITFEGRFTPAADGAGEASAGAASAKANTELLAMPAYEEGIDYYREVLNEAKKRQDEFPAGAGTLSESEVDTEVIICSANDADCSVGS